MSYVFSYRRKEQEELCIHVRCHDDWIDCNGMTESDDEVEYGQESEYPYIAC